MDFTLPVPIAEFLPKYEAAYVPCRSPKHSLQALEGRQQPMEWRGKAVQQTDMSQLPEHTRDLLRSIMDAKNTVQIHKQVCSSYQGDGKDFNVYYKVLLENLWTNERSHKRKVHQRDGDAYSAHVYQQGSKTLLYLLQGLGHRQAGDLIYNA